MATPIEPSLADEPNVALADEQDACENPSDDSRSPFPTPVDDTNKGRTDDDETGLVSFVAVDESKTIGTEDEDDDQPELVETSTDTSLSSEEEEHETSPTTTDSEEPVVETSTSNTEEQKRDEQEQIQPSTEVELEQSDDFEPETESTPVMEDVAKPDNDNKEEDQQESSKEEQQKQISAILNSIIETVEPHHYSIATYKDPNRALGLKLWELDHGGMLVMGIADGQANSIFASATSHAYPVDGDVLIGVNEKSCTSAKTTLMDVKRMVDQSEGKVLTLTFRRPDSKAAKQQAKKKTDSSLTEGSVQRLTILNPRDVSISLNDIEFVGETKDPKVMEVEEQENGDDEATPLDIRSDTQESAQEQPALLQIQSIVSSSWLSKCTCLAAEQVILKIQDRACFDMSPSEVRSLWQEELSKDPETLTITTYKLPQVKQGRHRLRRALLGVGGSVLVGAGVVIMATPLHPLGHAMALGGGHVMTYGGLGVISSQVKGQKKKSSSDDAAAPAKRTLGERWNNLRQRHRNAKSEASKGQKDDDTQKECEELPPMDACDDDIAGSTDGQEKETEDPSCEVEQTSERSASFLQRTRQSWIKSRRSDSSQSFDDLDGEIQQMERQLASNAKD
jgi:hypothetical protein